MTRTDDLCGVIVPVITPVDEHDRVDEAAYRKLIRRLIGAGVHALFVGGSAGEGPLLTEGEWRRMVSIARDEVEGQVHLLGGAMDTSTQRVREKIRVLASMEYPYCVVTPTYYISLRSHSEYIRLFGECIESADGMELIAYNIPSCVHSAIPPEALFEMAGRGWLRYVKESSGDFAYFERLAVEGAEYGLQLLEGEEPHIAQGMLAGAKGIVPVCANFEPQTYISAYEAGLARDESALRTLQERILLVRQRLLFSGPLWISGIKYAMACTGIGSGLPVSPLEPLGEEAQRSIDQFARETHLDCLGGHVV